MTSDESLAERCRDFVAALDSGAREEGATLILACGAKVFVKGIRRGVVEMGGKRITLTELAATVKGFTLADAEDFVSWWLDARAEEEARRLEHKSDEPGGGPAARFQPPFEPEPEELRGPEPEPERAIVPVNGARPAHHRPDVHRLLPQSMDAEKGILCSFLLAPIEVGAHCQKKGVEPSWFHSPVYAELFEEMQFFWREGTPLDFITLTESFRNKGRLDHVGGAAAVTELFTFLPTAANLEYYIEIANEKRTLREMIAFHTGIAARSYDEQDNVPALVAEAEMGMALIVARRQHGNEEPLTSLMEIDAGPPEPRATVLGDRFLCLHGALLFVGPSGIGKSSASMQQDILWALGREAFGIRPARPLRVLCIQAENDKADLTEMREGVARGLKLTAEELEMVRRNVFYAEECGRTGADFLARVDRLLAGGNFDILRIDPFLSYLGADVNDAEATAAFLIAALNPILRKHGVACVLNHHTPKVTNRDTSGWRASDWMYAGAGSAVITNWARAILVIDPTHTPHLFKFIAAKRGNRIGWADEEGARVTVRHFCHAKDGIYWVAATDEDMAEAEDKKPVKKGTFREEYSVEKFAAELEVLTGIKVVDFKRKMDAATGMTKSTFYRLVGSAKMKKLIVEKGGLLFRVAQGGGR